MIREVKEGDLKQILALYAHFEQNPFKTPNITTHTKEIWENILHDENYHIIVAECEKEIVASCTAIIIPNLNHYQKPYALIENVITHKEYRKQGYGSECLDYAKKLAVQKNCFKIMLLTGSKEESTLRFYEKAGYNKNDKTGFVMWLL